MVAGWYGRIVTWTVHTEVWTIFSPSHVLLSRMKVDERLTTYG